MAKWSQSYTAKTEQPELAPIYALVICEDWTYARPNDTMLENAVGVAETSLQLPSDGDFSAIPGDLIWLYDQQGFEVAEIRTFDTVTQNIGLLTRGQGGTTAKNFDRGAVVVKPLALFSTQAINGTTLSFTKGMTFPSGGGQEYDLREGRTNVDDVTIEVQDANADVPRYFKKSPIIGLRAIILGGYEGMAFEHYSFLWVGSITEMTNYNTNIYSFVIDSVFAKLKKELFGDIEDFDATLTNNISSSDTSFDVTDTSTAYLNSAAQTMGTPTGWGEEMVCGIVYKIDDEYILSNGGTGNTIGVAFGGGRGWWGSTPAAHTIGDEVDVFFSYQGPPIEFLIGLLLTKQTDTDSLLFTRSDLLHYDWGSVMDIDRDPLAIGIEYGDVEIQSFLDIRERWFADYIFRYKFGKRMDMENTIPKHILKPLGLAFYMNRAGKLALGIMKPPAGIDSPVIDKFVGVPSIKYDATEIINEVVVKFDYDGEEFQDEVRLIDGASQVTYGRQDAVTLECLGLDTSLRGESIAPRIARRKIRPLKDPNPVVSVETFFSHSGLEMTQVVRLVHPDLPNVATGSVGWDKLVMIVGKRPDWETGSLVFDVIDTNYFGKRYGLIAPSGTSDYSSASDETKETYCFISDMNGKMSDGTDGYMIS